MKPENNVTPEATAITICDLVSLKRMIVEIRPNKKSVMEIANHSNTFRKLVNSKIISYDDAKSKE